VKQRDGGLVPPRYRDGVVDRPLRKLREIDRTEYALDLKHLGSQRLAMSYRRSSVVARLYDQHGRSAEHISVM
jgi:hypothetical protein